MPTTIGESSSDENSGKPPVQPTFRSPSTGTKRKTIRLKNDGKSVKRKVPPNLRSPDSHKTTTRQQSGKRLLIPAKKRIRKTPKEPTRRSERLANKKNPEVPNIPPKNQPTTKKTNNLENLSPEMTDQYWDSKITYNNPKTKTPQSKTKTPFQPLDSTSSDPKPKPSPELTTEYWDSRVTYTNDTPTHPNPEEAQQKTKSPVSMSPEMTQNYWDSKVMDIPDKTPSIEQPATPRIEQPIAVPSTSKQIEQPVAIPGCSWQIDDYTPEQSVATPGCSWQIDDSTPAMDIEPTFRSPPWIPHETTDYSKSDESRPTRPRERSRALTNQYHNMSPSSESDSDNDSAYQPSQYQRKRLTQQNSPTPEHQNKNRIRPLRRQTTVL